MDDFGDTMMLKGVQAHDARNMITGTLTIEAGPEGNLQYSPVKLHLASGCDFAGALRRQTRMEVELYNREDEQETKNIEFTPLCLEVEFMGN